MTDWTTDTLTDACIEVAQELGARLFRNNSGLAIFGVGKKKRRVRYGVGTTKGGGGDWLGWTKSGRFLSVEIKVGDDTPSVHQKTWAKWVRLGGGIAITAYSPDDVREALEKEEPLPRMK